MEKSAVVIGAGVAGLASAVRLASQGYQVVVLEANSGPGGKLAEIRQQGYRFDAGPSLFTLPGEVDALFRLAGKNPGDYFSYRKLGTVTRYFYGDGTVINAFSDIPALADEIAAKTGEPKEHIHKFLKKSQMLYETTQGVFLRRSLHKLSTYYSRETLRAYSKLHRIDAFRTMHQANKAAFSDSRVVQLFDRFATYNGSSPYLCPATLNIIPYLEHGIGAFFPDKGMFSIAESLAALAQDLGVRFCYGTKADKIAVQSGSATGVYAAGEFFPVSVTVSNMDVAKTYRHLLKDTPAPERTLSQPKSSSALIFYWGMDRQFPTLDLHNIFFSGNYRAEFGAIGKAREIYHDPTVYVFVSAKACPADAPPGCENWFVMINVPPDQGQDWPGLAQQARRYILAKLSKMLGTGIEEHIVCESVLDPPLIASRTSSDQGALYGNSSNNRFAAFLRHPNFSSKVKQLYFCGGSVHPGGGIPLCLLSAQITADLVKKDMG